MKSGCLMIGVDPGGEGSLPVITVFKNEGNGSYSVLKSFTGEEAEVLYKVLTSKKVHIQRDDEDVDEHELLMRAFKKHCEKE